MVNLLGDGNVRPKRPLKMGPADVAHCGWFVSRGGVSSGEDQMSLKIRLSHNLLGIGVAITFVTLSLTLNAQVNTQTSTTSSGAPTVTTSVERGEVVFVQGNHLIVKMDNGSLRDFPNVSESARVSVDGKQLGIHDLKPGMKLERTITTTTTPKTITTVQTVSGRIWRVNPPRSVTLTLDDNTNQTFDIPKDQKFNVNGQIVDAWGLKKGMTITATKVVEQPTTDVERQEYVSGSMPKQQASASVPTPPPPPPDQPILVAVVVPTPGPATPAALPHTGSILPLIGLLGFVSLAASLALRKFRC
jgi:hypothetical protein